MTATIPAEETKRVSEPRAIEQALDAELRRFDRVIVRVWQLFALVSLFLGPLFAFTVALKLGIACTLTAGAYLIWFVVLGRRLGRAPLRGGWLFAAVTVESSIPWVFVVALVATEGPGYALGSWVPPMLFCALVVSHTARLRARASLVCGLIGAITFPVLYLVLMRDRLPEELASMVLYQTPMQITRAISVLLAGVLGMLIARGLRGAIGRAETVIRQTELFGKYRILDPIASGGMGTIHEALYCPEGGFERRVAVKRIHPQLAQQEWFVAGFRAEAEISSRLAHPNIVQVLDFGRVADTYFLAMEYVDGMPLSTLMRRAFLARVPLAPHLAGTIARDILAGLAHAHEAARGADGRPLRVVHRDMCPQNVLLSRNGEVKIADFGVARVLKDATASTTQHVVGHSAYMAPEQAQGRPIDTRADLFPVGVILWELLAGRRLFHRGVESATLLALLYEEVVPPTVMRADIHPGWDDVILRALARDPDARWASAREMTAALDAVADARSERASTELAEMVELLAASPDAGEVSASDLDPTSLDLPRGPRG